MTNAKPSGDGSGTSGTCADERAALRPNVAALAGSMSLPGRDALLRVPFLLCASPEETQALGVRFAAALEQGAVLSLEGPLGAGKTQFVKGFATALGHAGEVSSPTFTLVHEYMGGKSPLVHFDWYRLDEINGVIGLGWDDYLTCGETLLVEWGDKFVELLPAGTWRVRFEIRDTARFVKWERMP